MTNTENQRLLNSLDYTSAPWRRNQLITKRPRLFGKRNRSLLFQTSSTNFPKCWGPQAGLCGGCVPPVSGCSATPLKQQWGWVMKKNLSDTLNQPDEEFRRGSDWKAVGQPLSDAIHILGERSVSVKFTGPISILMLKDHTHRLLEWLERHKQLLPTFPPKCCLCFSLVWSGRCVVIDLKVCK